MLQQMGEDRRSGVQRLLLAAGLRGLLRGDEPEGRLASITSTLGRSITAHGCFRTNTCDFLAGEHGIDLR
jgi:hypothetical protein